MYFSRISGGQNSVFMLLLLSRFTAIRGNSESRITNSHLTYLYKCLVLSPINRITWQALLNLSFKSVQLSFYKSYSQGLRCVK